MKILTIGGATQDIFLNFQGADSISITKKDGVSHFMLFESGQKIEVDNLAVLTGGGATNAAVSFKRLGFQTSCLCAVGSDSAGSEVVKELTLEGIDTQPIQIASKEKTAVSYIISTLQNERTIFVFRGANRSLDLTGFSFEALPSFNYLYITSLTGNASTHLPWLTTQAKKLNIPVAINPGTSQLAQGTATLKKSLCNIDILIMNYSEAKTFMFALVGIEEEYKSILAEYGQMNQCKADDQKPYLLESPIPYENIYFSIKKFFTQMLKMGPKIVVITNGCNGVYVATGKEGFFHPSIKTNVVDTVGAGDSFGSCFVASIIKGMSVQDALRNGVINSASVLQFVGAKQGLLKEHQLREKVTQVPSNLIQKFEI